jgi:hypothetical protein
LADGVGLFEQGSCFVETASVYAHAGTGGQGDRQQRQHALFAQDPYLSGR